MKDGKINWPLYTSIFHSELDLDKNSEIGKECSLRGGLNLGRGSKLNQRCEIRGDVKIGNFCAIGRDVTFQARNHNYNYLGIQVKLYSEVLDEEFSFVESEITVGNDVWIGKGATILPGVSIGNGAVIGADSVVTSDVESYEIVAGNPAERIGKRFTDDKKELIEELSWWEWPESKLRNNSEIFRKKLSDLSVSEIEKWVRENE